MARFSLTLIAAATLASLSACSDRSLYGDGQVPVDDDKLNLQGQLCTDNPATRRFPVKILFLVDASGEREEAASGKQIVDAIQDIINRNLPIKNVEFGFIRYGTRAESLITEEVGRTNVGFTRDSAKIDTALAALPNTAGTRDFAAAISLASSVVTGDVYQADLGPLSRTKYMLVNVTAGSPDPQVPNVRCEEYDPVPDDCEPAYLETRIRALRDAVLEAGAAEFSFHTVLIEPAIAPGAACDPSGANSCGAGQICVQTGSLATSGRCASSCTQNSDCPATYPRCNTVTQGSTELRFCAAVEASCFDGADNDGDGSTMDCASDDYPYTCTSTTAGGSGSCEADCQSLCRAQKLGVEMSLAAGGSYQRFASGDAFTLGELNFLSTQRLFVLKEFLVYNRNAVATADGFVPDTDADGLSDSEEQSLGLDPLKADTDGDYYNDKLENMFRTLGLDPLVQNSFPDCDDPTVDTDGDGLRDCEEKLLSTNRTLFDTDADGYPDLVEFNVGANPLANDTLDDLDLDGSKNGAEILAHTDLLSNESRLRTDMSVRYSISAATVTAEQRSCYAIRVTNVTLMNTLDRGYGTGNNDIDIYFGQVPDGAITSYGVFHVAQLHMQYTPPATRVPDTYVLDLDEDDFVLFEQ